MNLIFHYYATGFLALRAGFEPAEARIIAYSAQYVDHALVPHRVEADKPGGGRAVYRTMATHHFGFWDPAQEDSVWLPFHFFPGGDPAPRPGRIDRRASVEAVVPNGEPVRELLVAALRSDDPYRIGIALHCYADSWAHQNFTGRRDDFNTLSAGSLIPPIGHAQAESAPDIMHARWLDGRFEAPEVDNRRRFLEAARLMYKYLATNRRRSFADAPAVLADLERMLGPVVDNDEAVGLAAGLAGAIRQKIDLLRETKRHPLLCGADDAELERLLRIGTGMPPYQRGAWRREALAGVDDSLFADERVANVNDKAAWLKHELWRRAGAEPPVVRAGPGFFDSHWHRWSEAARDHAAAAREIIARI